MKNFSTVSLLDDNEMILITFGLCCFTAFKTTCLNLVKRVELQHLPSAYKAPWQGQTPTPQRGKFRDATAAHCLVTGSYLSVQSKIIESFSPGEKNNKTHCHTDNHSPYVIILTQAQLSDLPPHISCPPGLQLPAHCAPDAGMTQWSSTGWRCRSALRNSTPGCHSSGRPATACSLLTGGNKWR